MPFVRSAISLLATLLLLSSCSRNVDEQPVLVSVYDQKLYASDLQGIVPPGLSPEDSLAIVDNYIEQWIRQAVILDKASKNVDNSFDRELREYKNSLLVYNYERQIIDQLIDTSVTDLQIQEYYSQHKADFTLRSSIVKAVYVIAPLKSPAVAKLKKIVARGSFSERDIIELEETASRYGCSGFYDAETWIPFHALQNAVPITAYNESLFLKQHRAITLSDDSLFYAARILDYKVTDDISPLDLQRDNIRAVLLNHRKVELLENLRSDLLREAESGGHVKRMKN
jgi:hypothetical protein